MGWVWYVVWLGGGEMRRGFLMGVRLGCGRVRYVGIDLRRGEGNKKDGVSGRG